MSSKHVNIPSGREKTNRRWEGIILYSDRRHRHLTEIQKQLIELTQMKFQHKQVEPGRFYSSQADPIRAEPIVCAAAGASVSTISL